MSTHQVPLVKVQVPRSPMNIHTKAVPAHEVFILLHMFPGTEVLDTVKDEKGRVVTRMVDSAAEYDRLVRAYGSKPESDTSRCEDVFGPPFGQAWRGALEGGLDNFEIPESEPESGQAETRPRVRLEQIVGIIAMMERDDPDKTNDKFWTTNGKPEVAELKRRGINASAAERDQAVAMLAGKDTAPAETPADQDDSNDDGEINVVAVKARLDDLEVAYDPDAGGIELIDLLHERTVSGIEALGGEADPEASLQTLSEHLDRLRAEADDPDSAVA